MPENILIVGGAGYIGGYLTDVLAEQYDVTVYDNLLYEQRYMKNVHFIYGDVRDTVKLMQVLPMFDTVIWLAAIVGDGACAVDPELTRAINEKSAIWLAEHFDGRIVYLSTCSVYGKNDVLLTEESPTKPLSLYAETKLHAEQYILNHANQDALVFRLGTLFGVGDSHSRVRFDLVVNALTTKAARREPMMVYSGDQYRPFLHVRDVANAISFALSNDITGLYNLTAYNHQIKHAAKLIQRLIPGSTIIASNLSPADQRNYRVKCDKFTELGWEPEFTLEFGIFQIMNIIYENRVRDINDSLYQNANYIKELYGTAN